jgi:hypothetical protein
MMAADAARMKPRKGYWLTIFFIAELKELF